jgi:hypothetical protein
VTGVCGILQDPRPTPIAIPPTVLTPWSASVVPVKILKKETHPTKQSYTISNEVAEILPNNPLKGQKKTFPEKVLVSNFSNGIFQISLNVDNSPKPISKAVIHIDENLEKEELFPDSAEVTEKFIIKQPSSIKIKKNKEPVLNSDLQLELPLILATINPKMVDTFHVEQIDHEGSGSGSGSSKDVVTIRGTLRPTTAGFLNHQNQGELSFCVQGT